ncbi:hypothetical protein PHYPSEUDO_015233 [Phytophthora pseudosyringae]|uniref:RxLR effector protein n=1 Tax=Phytophthora pseudosyringae TaxID=221518 RepID=A0A8T1W043_9STRA|nr:hypothetical protein PHYPSEUDO_015233 [Phytophthora pseudosyringae]
MVLMLFAPFLSIAVMTATEQTARTGMATNRADASDLARAVIVGTSGRLQPVLPHGASAFHHRQQLLQYLLGRHPVQVDEQNPVFRMNASSTPSWPS